MVKIKIDLADYGYTVRNNKNGCCYILGIPNKVLLPSASVHPVQIWGLNELLVIWPLVQ